MAKWPLSRRERLFREGATTAATAQWNRALRPALLISTAMTAACASASDLAAQEEPLRLNILEIAGDNLNRLDLSLTAALTMVGIVVFAATFAVQHIRQRRLWQQHARQQSDLIENLRAEYDRASMFLKGERQILVAWHGSQSEPVIEGDVSIVLDAPAPRRILGFGSWLASAPARTLEKLVEQLRKQGTIFDLTVEALNGSVIDITGRTDGGAALLRLKDVSGDRKALRKLEREHSQLKAKAATMTQLLEAAPIRSGYATPMTS